MVAQNLIDVNPEHLRMSLCSGEWGKRCFLHITRGTGSVYHDPKFLWADFRRCGVYGVLGQGDTRTIERVLGITLRFSLSMAVLFTTAVCLFPYQIMGLFTPEADAIEYREQYLKIVSFPIYSYGDDDLFNSCAVWNG